MCGTVEHQVDPVVGESFALQSIGRTCPAQCVHCGLFEDSRALPLFDVFAASALEHHGVDPGQVQQPAQQ